MASKELQHAQKDATYWRSEIYPVGTLYALCLATAQIMLAILGVLSQSVTESIKGFYKLRKALQTLQATSEAETKYLKSSGFQDGMNDANEAQELFQHPFDKWISSTTLSQYGILLIIISMVPAGFVRFLSIIGFQGDRDRGLVYLWRATKYADFNGSTAGLFLLGYYNDLIACLDIRPANAYPLDRLRGLLKVMRSRYPRSQFWLLEEARLLSAEKNTEAAVALVRPREPSLVNGNTEDGDVVDEFTPRTSFKQLAAQMHFRLSLDLMYLHDYEACADSFIKYIGLTDWGHGIYYYIAGAAHLELYRIYKEGGTLSDFSATSTTFKSVAASAEKAALHARLAEKHLTEAPKHTGKKRIFGRPIPFDDFVARKIGKWRKHATSIKCSFIDAVGPSPFEELIYFWNGYGRMLPAQLHHSLGRLSSDKALSSSPSMEKVENGNSSSVQSIATTEPIDDAAISNLLRACVYRHLSRTSEARALLKASIIDAHTWSEFRAGASSGNFGDTYPPPMARYELAACLWAERYEAAKESNRRVNDETGMAVDRSKVEACGILLDEVARWVRPCCQIIRG